MDKDLTLADKDLPALKSKKIELVVTLSPATAPRCVDTCNLSATNTHYTHYDNL